MRSTSRVHIDNEFSSDQHDAAMAATALSLVRLGGRWYGVPVRLTTSRHRRSLAIAATLCALPLGLILCLGLGACSSNNPDDTSFNCMAPPVDMAACTTVDDCTAYAIGCYCGAQPINGVAREFAPDMQSCENKAASMCALGCPTEPGLRTQDGKMVSSGTMISVRCVHQGNTGTCQTYVP